MINLGEYRPMLRFGGNFEEDKKTELKNHTKAYLKILQRPMKEGLIEFISTVIIGVMGYGKTELAKWIAVQVLSHYGAGEVNCIMNRSADLDAILDAMDDRPVQLLFLDDSFGKMPEDMAHQFTLIRHRFKDVLDAAGKPEMGVIVALFGIQDLYALDKLARRVSTALIAKSSTGDKWYKNDLKQTFGAAGIEELDRITREVTHNYDQDVKSRSVITITGYKKTGYLESSMVEGNPFTEVVSSEKKAGPQSNIEVAEARVNGAKFVRQEEDPAFIEELLGCLSSDRDAQIFRLFLDGSSTRDISRTSFCEVGHRQVQNIVKKIREKELGYAAEDALHERHPGWAHVGGNTPEPDFIDHERRRVISLKAYLNSDISKNSGVSLSRRIAKTEYSEARRLGYDLILLVYELDRRTWYEWEIPLPNPTPLSAHLDPDGHAGAHTQAVDGQRPGQGPMGEAHPDAAGGTGDDIGSDADEERLGMGVGQSGFMALIYGDPAEDGVEAGEAQKRLEEDLDPVAVMKARELIGLAVDNAEGSGLTTTLVLEGLLVQMGRVRDSGEGELTPLIIGDAITYVERYREALP